MGHVTCGVVVVRGESVGQWEWVMVQDTLKKCALPSWRSTLQFQQSTQSHTTSVNCNH